VVASDIYCNDRIKGLQTIDFVQCGIADTPFSDEQFDIVFSNHVIEHLEDIASSLRETQRIGKASCVYAFSVPTNIWLLLFLPIHYYNKLRGLKRKLLKGPGNSNKLNNVKGPHNISTIDKGDSTRSKYLRSILPRGHGVSSNFLNCYSDFRIKSWWRLFINAGFCIRKIQPLLLYGPSEWPIIPTLRCKTALCSSVLFLMTNNFETIQQAKPLSGDVPPGNGQTALLLIP